LETHILSGDGLNFACWTRFDSGHLITCLPDEFDSRRVCGGEARSAVTPARLWVNANENDSQQDGPFCRDFVATDHQLAHARCRRGTIASACEGPVHGRTIDPVDLKGESVFQAVKSNTFAMGVCPFGVTATARVPSMRRTQPASKLCRQGRRRGVQPDAAAARSSRGTAGRSDG
jgi:hypothetical protein